jgi:hypothetical protein
VTADDERFSLKAARAAMLILSAIATLGYLFSLNPFAISFNVSFVYLPTAVLVLGPLVAKAKRKERASSS